jgi:DNA-binding transcriptional LysR family regulator
MSSISRPDLELRLLYYFVTVADCESFTLAAAQAGIAQPPLSQQIRQLEEILGCALFDRSARQVRLTDAGRALLPEARRALAQVAALKERAGAFGQTEQPRLTIGYATSTLFSVLPRALTEFRARHPDVDVELRELSSAAQLIALRAESIDLAWLREPEHDSDLTFAVVQRDRFVAALPASHRLAKRTSIQLGALRDEQFIHFPREVSPALHDQLTRVFAASRVVPRIVQEAYEWQTVVALVNAGLGVALVPDSFRSLRMDGVRYVALSGKPHETRVVACHLQRRDPVVLTSFLSIVTELARERGETRLHLSVKQSA